MRRALTISSFLALVLFASFGSCGEPDDDGSILARAEGAPSGLEEAAWGELLFASHGCVGCHSINGSRGVGGSLAHLYGRPRTLLGGEQVVADDDYIRRSLFEPSAELLEGFEPSMPSYEGLLDEDQVAALTAYLRSLQ